MDVDQEEQEEPHSWVEQEEPYSCGACGKRVTSNRINRARWYAYNHPSGWLEYGHLWPMLALLMAEHDAQLGPKHCVMLVLALVLVLVRVDAGTGTGTPTVAW